MDSVRKSRWVVLAGIAAALVLTLWPRADVARGDGPTNGLPTESELTAQWWEWVISLPVSENPLFDETGEFAANQQPFKKVFFLVGVISVSGTAERSITVPEGTAFFFPVINFEDDNVGVPKNARLTAPQLAAVVKGATDAVEDYFVTLDGVSLHESVARVQSPPFAFQLPETDNIYQFFGVDVSGAQAPAASDGYWFYLPPLPKGTYDLNFGGSAPGFALDITYHITIE